MTNAIWDYARGDRVKVVNYDSQFPHDGDEARLDGFYGTVMKPFNSDSGFYVDVILDPGAPQSGMGTSLRQYLFTPEEILPA